MADEQNTQQEPQGQNQKFRNRFSNLKSGFNIVWD